MVSINTQLEASRQSLLDLSTRNRLLSVPQKSKHAKIVEIVDELTPEIFRLLVKEGKALSFLPGKEKKKTEVTDVAGQENDLPALVDGDEDHFGELPQPDEDEEIDERGIAKRHTDHKLQTLLTSEGLQKRLLSLYYDAITFEQEQGVNILYLALGMLKWFEDDNSDVERYAPLALVPVSLERGSAAERFKIKWRQEDPAANLSLQAKMKAEFGLIIPDLPEDDDFDISAYMKTVQEIVSAKSRFEVQENKMVLGFFSFAKFLMYRDLDVANWPENDRLDRHPLIAGLMQHGFPAAEGMIGEDEDVDKHLPPEKIFHVVDADSSQTLAIEEVRRGRNLVIQGPPGTGKSQTITNVIASAVADGKKVLFVAEKMAALEVVQRRMTNIGLGPLCFELHSAKSNKKIVLDDLKRTRDLGRPKGHDGDAAIAKLRALQAKLNAHATVLHIPHQPSGLTAYKIIGNLVRLKEGGVEARGISLEKPGEWSSESKREKESLLTDVASRIREIGIPAQHIWRGVSRPQFLPNEFDELVEQISSVEKSYTDVLKDILKVETLFPSAKKTIASFNLAREAALAVAGMPEADCSAWACPLWNDNKPLIDEIVQNGLRYKELREKLSGTVSETTWSTDLIECRQQIAIHGESLLRIFQSKYRQSVSLLQSLLVGPMPAGHKSRLEILDDVLMAQRAEKFLQENDDTGRKVFGRLWQGTRSDWQKLSSLVQWHGNLNFGVLPQDFLSGCAKITDGKEWKLLSDHLNLTVPNFLDQLSSLMGTLKFDVSVGFESAASIGDADRDIVSMRISEWRDNIESVSKWINFKIRFDKLKDEGLEALASKLWDGSISPAAVLGIFERAYFDAMTEIVFSQHPDLRNFDGEEHHINVANFRENDNYRIEQARVELRGKHFNSMPRSEGGLGPLGVLNGEFAKKRNHLPIRQLIKRAGLAIQALKPVFMMSPLSVAQFLEPGSLQFDLLVIDEASQIEPVDALGAIARAKQIVVVGDTRQLPPTRFFARATGNLADNDNEEEDDTVATHDVESILSLCLARGLPQRMLRWHYRSKHQSLIAVSNKEFYENKLYIIPSPYDAASGMGLKFNYLANGVFDSGGTATNQVEAKAVAEAVIKHAKETPSLSLGVGTFSMKQKQAIIDELELLRRKNPDTESFFSSAHPDEPFFVKNLENIQGDERDVILISVGYGKNQNGYMAMRFGPLSSEGGERRLNVLISRAKRRCEVFSSITADDIDLERAKGAGVAALKLFLKFAQTGKLDYGKVTDREPDSIFEEQVAAALRAKGLDVKTQIGIAGFFVDIAVVDPDRPGRFLLGIECDGASYHSSRSARDRDRLRQSVLEAHGWIIHRIWSTDWFRRPKEQLEKTLAAIEGAKSVLNAREQEPEDHKPRGVFEIAANDETLTVRVGEKELSTLYKEASIPVPAHIEPHEVLDNEMALIVSKIIEIETPIHESEIIARIRFLWNLARAGSRIQAKVQSALKFAQRKGTVSKEGDFYFIQGAEILVRDRSNASSSTLRKPECIPPQEIKKAVLSLIEANFGAERERVVVEVARLFGFKSTSAQLREVITGVVNSLVSQEIIVESEGILSLNAKSTEAKG